MKLRNWLCGALAAVTIASMSMPARAEVSEVRISKGFGILYLR
jgi:NitT/TauT family transport system substrate-binding protein